MMLSLILALVIFTAICLVSTLGDRKVLWNKEIDASIERNLKDPLCPVIQLTQTTFVDPKRLPLQNSTISIRRIFPSDRELQYLRSLPESLSFADTKVPEYAAKRSYSYDQWAAESGLRWEIPDNHPGQNRENCISMTRLASEGRPVSFYQEFRDIDRATYFVYLKHGFVHPSGAVVSPCGFYRGEEGCETRWERGKDWSDSCMEGMRKYWLEELSLKDTLTKQQLHLAAREKSRDWTLFWRLTDHLGVNNENPATLVAHTLSIPSTRVVPSHERDLWRTCMTFAESDTPYGGKLHNTTLPENQRPRRVDTLVVIPALWDFNYHHFLADSFARLIHLLPLLRRRTDIFIHIRNFEIYDGMYFDDEPFLRNAQAMRRRLFHFFGIEAHRILWGPVLADTVIVPRPTRCSFALSNPTELLKLRTTMSNMILKKLKAENAVEHKERVQHLLYLTQHLLGRTGRKGRSGDESDGPLLPERRRLEADGDVEEEQEEEELTRPLQQRSQRSLAQKMVKTMPHGGKRNKRPPATKKAPSTSTSTSIALAEMDALPVHALTDVLPTKQQVLTVEGDRGHDLGATDDDRVDPATGGATTAAASVSADRSTAHQRASNHPSEGAAAGAASTPGHDARLPANYQPPRKTLILMQRYTPYVSSDRDWSDRTTDRLQSALQTVFPAHNIVRLSSKPKTRAQSSSSSSDQDQSGDADGDVCLHCDWKHWLTADIVVAAHGAGLTNIVLLPPHALVVEIAGEIKDVNMPVCGYYGPLASMVGAHHYLYVHDMTPPFAVDGMRPAPPAMTRDADNADFALPVHDVAQKALEVYQWLTRHRQHMESVAPAATVMVGEQALAPGVLPQTSVAYRPEVQPRVGVVSLPHGQVLRVHNSTAGPIAARP